MKKHMQRHVLGILCLALLTGCQTTSKQPAPGAETQVAQLSSMVAAASWLRDRCNRQDIGDDLSLMRSALRQAKLRGWDTQQPAYHQVKPQVAERYQAITDDSVPQDEKCSTLNRATAQFLQQTHVNPA